MRGFPSVEGASPEFDGPGLRVRPMEKLDRMRYAEVAVDAPVAHSRTFSYSIPPHFNVTPGQLVWVPFGRRTAQGVVVELAATPQVELTKDILQPVEPAPLVSPAHLKLARWLSRYYLCSLFAAIAPLLPPGFERQVRSRVFPASRDNLDPSNLRPETQEALQKLETASELTEEELTGLLGRNGNRELSRLLQKGLVRRRVEMPRPRIAPRYVSNLLAGPSGGAPRGGGWGPVVLPSARVAWVRYGKRRRHIRRPWPTNSSGPASRTR